MHRDVAIIIIAGVLTQNGYEPASFEGGKGQGTKPSVIIPARTNPLNPGICRCAANLLALPCQTVPVRSRDPPGEGMRTWITICGDDRGRHFHPISNT